MLRILATLLFTLVSSLAAQAQELFWVQVEAKSTLADAEQRARDYAAYFNNVNGYSLSSGWYAIALGPYAKIEAQTQLLTLTAQGTVPADSFITDGGNFVRQFWPVGGTALTTTPNATATTTETPVTDTAQTPAVVETPAAPALPDETPAQARASESQLTEAQRKELQVALGWAGFYNSTIDGAFGRGTRGAMEAWQTANGHEPTGILTTGQRAELLGAYNAVLEGLDLQAYRDDEAGISIDMPLGVVGFDRYEPPFAHYEPKGDLPVRVILISQEGDANAFKGLYEILQTLEVLPPEGPRSRGDRSFDIDGQDATRHAYAHVEISGTTIKGYILDWPAGDEDRRSRVLAEMSQSFAPVDGVLDPALAPPDEAQATDLVSGLAVRSPRLSRSGFYIDGRGTVLTTTEAIDQCARVTIDEAHEADVTFSDAALGLAVLKPREALSPVGFVTFQTGVPRLQDQVAVGGYPYGRVLPRPTLTFGTLEDLRGLNGEETVKRLALTAQAGDAGGPVFGPGGLVLGMLLPRNDAGGQVLPSDVAFALDTDTILGALGAAGVQARTTETAPFVAPEVLTRQAAGETVLVSCWD